MPINNMKLLTLEEIQKRVDYEKCCNFGLYLRQEDYPEELLEHTLEELLGIQEHCND